MNTPEDGFDRLGTFPDNMPVMVIAGDCGWNPWIEGSNDGKVAVAETPLPTPHTARRVHTSHCIFPLVPKIWRQAREFLAEERPPVDPL